MISVGSCERVAACVNYERKEGSVELDPIRADAVDREAVDGHSKVSACRPVLVQSGDLTVRCVLKISFSILCPSWSRSEREGGGSERGELSRFEVCLRFLSCSFADRDVDRDPACHRPKPEQVQSESPEISPPISPPSSQSSTPASPLRLTHFSSCPYPSSPVAVNYCSPPHSPSCLPPPRPTSRSRLDASRSSTLRRRRTRRWRRSRW